PELEASVSPHLHPHQPLLLIGPLASGGASLEAAPLIRHIAASAYQAGARLVETLWGDQALQIARYKHAPRDSFTEFSTWLPQALTEHAEAGHALLSVYANDPDLLKDEAPDLVGTVQKAIARDMRPFRELIARNQTNWTVIAAPSVGWAAKVFPQASEPMQMSRLWDAIATLCRMDAPDPLAAWEAHLKALDARSEYLNRRQYDALKYTGPGTDLTIGLPAGHVWVSGRSSSRAGIAFTANLPTEEVFTMPHKDRVDGTVTSSKPLSYGGTMTDGFSLCFSAGQVVKLTATHGEAMLRQLVETDSGAGRLGEVALVPYSSPISKSGLLFYNTLFDENAASHIALGQSHSHCISYAGRHTP